MKIIKTLVLTLFFILILTSTTICHGGFDVYPRELTITMDDEFIFGNTSRSILIQNLDDNSVNITWYLDHPNPISWIRPNRTLIPELMWINVKPKYNIIPPKDSAKFDVYLNIPKKEENLKKNWETWIVFKEEENKFFNFEATVRLLIDTPLKLKNKNNQDIDFLSIKIGDKIKITISDVVIIALIIILIIIGILVIKKKKSKKS